MEKLLIYIAVLLFIFAVYRYIQARHSQDYIHYDGEDYVIKENAIYKLDNDSFNRTESIYIKLTDLKLQVIVIYKLLNYTCDNLSGQYNAQQYLSNNEVQHISLEKGTKCFENGGKIPDVFVVTKKNINWNNYLKSLELNNDKFPMQKDPIKFATD